MFDNDFAALLPATEPGELKEGGILLAENERGICRVVCFHPDHSLTVARMSVGQIEAVVDEWVRQYREIGALDFIRSVQIFENRGEMMGASNPHPHCQIWANENLPNELSAEVTSFEEHRGECLICDYLKIEGQDGRRRVCENVHFTALVPFWAVWPFETMIVPKRHFAGMEQMSPEEREALAQIMKALTTRYDNLFQVSFPYTMGFHQRPTDGQEHGKFHFHAHYYPPLLRSATVKKFMVGYEMLGTPQRGHYTRVRS